MSALVDTAAWLLAQMASAIQYHAEAASHRCNDLVLRISFSSFTRKMSVCTALRMLEQQHRFKASYCPTSVSGGGSVGETRGAPQAAPALKPLSRLRFTAFICYPHTRLRIGGHHTVQVCGKTNLVFPLWVSWLVEGRCRFTASRGKDERGWSMRPSLTVD